MALILSGDTGPSFVQDAAMPAGSVLQVVSATDSTSGEVTTSMAAVSGLSLNITPISTSSRILLLLSGDDIITNDPNRNLYTTFYRDSTNLATGVDYLSRYAGVASEIIVPHSMMIIDSPATTSSINYKVYAKYSGGNVYFSNQVAVMMVAMEIAG